MRKVHSKAKRAPELDIAMEDYNKIVEKIFNECFPEVTYKYI